MPAQQKYVDVPRVMNSNVLYTSQVSGGDYGQGMLTRTETGGNVLDFNKMMDSQGGTGRF